MAAATASPAAAVAAAWAGGSTRNDDFELLATSDEHRRPEANCHPRHQQCHPGWQWVIAASALTLFSVLLLLAVVSGGARATGSSAARHGVALRGLSSDAETLPTGTPDSQPANNQPPPGSNALVRDPQCNANCLQQYSSCIALNRLDCQVNYAACEAACSPGSTSSTAAPGGSYPPPVLPTPPPQGACQNACQSTFAQCLAMKGNNCEATFNSCMQQCSTAFSGAGWLQLPVGQAVAMPAAPAVPSGPAVAAAPSFQPVEATAAAAPAMSVTVPGVLPPPLGPVWQTAAMEQPTLQPTALNSGAQTGSASGT